MGCPRRVNGHWCERVEICLILLRKERNEELAQWIERWTVVREVEGPSPGLTNTQGLKMIEKNMPPFYKIRKWLDILVFSDRDE